MLEPEIGYERKTEYVLDGSRIISETTSETFNVDAGFTELYTLVYIYDEMGAPIGLKYRTPSYANGVFDCYFFEKNLQGDIVAIYNESGTKIGTYTYDAWGNCTVNPTSGYNFILYNNPFRYRGYYYDTDIGYYYLQSRYYNPVWGRFINADNQIPGIGGAPIGYNLFAYCYNNPTNFIDPTGHWPNWDKLVQGALLTFIGIGVAAATISSFGTMTGPACALGVMAASLVFTASVTTAAIGVSEMGEGLTGTNVISDAVGEEKYQEIKDVSLLITTIGVSYLAGGGNFDICFIAGTPIATEDGHKAIEDIEVGDLVWATDTETGETALKEVVRLFRNETKEWIHITVNGETITCTPEHPFYSPVKGWTSAVDLRAGDILVMLNGEYVVVEQVQHELLESSEITYNFEVKDFHTYYAGDTEVLVHNACGERGIAGKGWAGDKTWKENIKTVQTVTDVRTINGQVLSESEARRLIDAAGGIVFRGPEKSLTGTHVYWHLHYYIDKAKHTIEIFKD